MQNKRVKFRTSRAFRNHTWMATEKEKRVINDAE
jgi:hypothetical protein